MRPPLVAYTPTPLVDVLFFIMVALLVKLLLLEWVHRIAKAGEEKYPWRWVLVTFFCAPTGPIILGFRQRRWVPCAVGCLLLLWVVGALYATCWLLSSFTYQLPNYELPWHELWYEFLRDTLTPSFLLGQSLPTILLILAPLILVARRCWCRSTFVLLGYVLAMLLLVIAWPTLVQLLMHAILQFQPHMERASVATAYNTMAIIHTVLFLLTDALPWLGYLLTPKAARRPFLPWLVAISTIGVILHILSCHLFLGLHENIADMLHLRFDNPYLIAHILNNLALAILALLLFLMVLLETRTTAPPHLPQSTVG